MKEIILFLEEYYSLLCYGGKQRDDITFTFILYKANPGNLLSFP
jgi:hypothetical protein